MINPHAKLKTVGQRFLKWLCGQAFWSQSPCDLYLKINMGHLLIMCKLHAKYEDWVKGIFIYWMDKLF
jgi:hypothetical protein